jgi:hypothetical protein
MKYWDIQDIITANKMKGQHFFDKDTMRFFRSRVLPRVYQGPGGIYFITSEKFVSRWSDYEGKRLYSVRRFNPKTADIGTMGDFNKLSRYLAIKYAKGLAANAKTPEPAIEVQS